MNEFVNNFQLMGKATAKNTLAGLKIRARRMQAGMTQGELARRAGISASYLNLIELNKRAIADVLVERIANSLGVERSELDGEAERRVVANLQEIAADPEIANAIDPPGPAADLIGRNPGWADLVLALHRAWHDQKEAATALADRLNRDPFLGDSVHRMLTHAASIRSASEILDTENGLSDAERRRFLAIVAADSQKLSGAAQSLLEFFDSTCSQVRSVTPAEMWMRSSWPPTITFPIWNPWPRTSSPAAPITNASSQPETSCLPSRPLPTPRKRDALHGSGERCGPKSPKRPGSLSTPIPPSHPRNPGAWRRRPWRLTPLPQR